MQLEYKILKTARVHSAMLKHPTEYEEREGEGVGGRGGGGGGRKQTYILTVVLTMSTHSLTLSGCVDSSRPISRRTAMPAREIRLSGWWGATSSARYTAAPATAARYNILHAGNKTHPAHLEIHLC